MKRICILTGTRAEYGLLRWLIDGVHNSIDLQLQLVVLGTHLSPEFGETKSEIERDGYPIAKAIEMLLSSDSNVGMCKSFGLGVLGLSDGLEELAPDIVIVLGDRYEMLAAAITCFMLRYPMLHIHGGEKTFGALDDSFRHCITKLSSIHCVSTKEFADRVIQLGECPSTVHIVGAAGLDNISNLKLLTREEIQTEYDIKLECNFVLATYHPETASGVDNEETAKNMCDALSSLKQTTVVFTSPNADAQGRKLKEYLVKRCAEEESFYFFDTLGQVGYLSFLNQADLVIGNSSSGIIEAPSLLTPTVNIGERQAGRIMAESVISCLGTKQLITEALDKALSLEFKKNLGSVINPYGTPGVSRKIVDILREALNNKITKSQFYDIGGQ